jgi:anthranilate synthase/aminodeoxychorismate synthase-like glutamine amidotransferase
MYFIDHYDSFSHNVIDWLTADDPDIQVIHLQFDDELSIKQINNQPLPIVLSPGPRHPDDSVATASLVKTLIGKVPILGVCLGHQILGLIAGFSIGTAAHPFHGSTVEITVKNPGILFDGVPKQFNAATYNSLVVKQESNGKIADDWVINALNQYGEIQGLSWSKDDAEPAFGVQFHPESFLTEENAQLRKNWLTVVKRFNDSARGKQS